MSVHNNSKLARLLKPTSTLVAIAQLAFVFALGLAANIVWDNFGAAAESSDEQEHEEVTKVQLWSCSMHPQIKKNKPGLCPICQMELISLKSDSGDMTGMRQFVVSPESRALMNIQVTPAERRYVEAEVRMVGKVDYDETRLKHITAWVPGRLDRLFVDYTGVQVKKGDHMVYIYSEQLYTAQEELIEAVRAKQVEDQRPGKGNFFTTGGIDLVESAREKLRLLGLTQDQIKEIESRDKPSDHTMIYAPMGGIVINKLKQEGDRVFTGERIYTVADLSHLWIRMDAYESDLMWLRYGQDVTFSTEAYPGEEFVGRIAFIDEFLDDQTRTVKVRVNIENPHGKLKPDMFVRAVVKAKVAAGGRVIDADLEGKWISPMHPEIIKDEPGTCDICGMALVRAETLGYVPPHTAGLSKPLVIPVSAALLTGTRAIVYVEDAKAKEPTFEGREIVLGPRAGDFYLVRGGLKEGELVVTSGNFKIDSALQILAKPSMMTPEGGGGGGHQHGETEKPKDESAHSDHTNHGDQASRLNLPISIRMRLQEVKAARQRITAAVKNQNLAAVRTGFAELGTSLAGIDGSLLEAHPQMVWKELGMLMANDATEGSQVIDLVDATRVLTSLNRSLERLEQPFDLSNLGDVPQRLAAPDEFRQQLRGIWQAYQQIGQALAEDNFDECRAGVKMLADALAAVDMKLLSDHQSHMVWMAEVKNLQKIGSALFEAEDIKTFREQFESLSSVMQILAMSFGFGEGDSVYVLHCSMAFNNKGASWLQADDETRNPYFGNAMLECANRKELIAGPPAASGVPPAPTKEDTSSNE